MFNMSSKWSAYSQMFVPEPRVKKSLRAEKKERNKTWGLQDGGEQGES